MSWQNNSVLLNIAHLVQYHIQSLILVTNNVAFEIIKVNVTPHTRAGINEPDSSEFTNQVLDVPAFTAHRLRAVTSLISDHLKYKETRTLRSQGKEVI